MRRTRNELRCFCSRSPLLAMYGLDSRGRAYVHVKVYKQKRIYGESVHYGGEVRIRCRECLRWNAIIFTSRKGEAILRETAPPPEVDSQGNMASNETEGTTP